MIIKNLFSKKNIKRYLTFFIIFEILYNLQRNFAFSNIDTQFIIFLKSFGIVTLLIFREIIFNDFSEASDQENFKLQNKKEVKEKILENIFLFISLLYVQLTSHPFEKYYIVSSLKIVLLCSLASAIISYIDYIFKKRHELVKDQVSFKNENIFKFLSYSMVFVLFVASAFFVTFENLNNFKTFLNMLKSN